MGLTVVCSKGIGPPDIQRRTSEPQGAVDKVLCDALYEWNSSDFPENAGPTGWCYLSAMLHTDVAHRLFCHGSE